MEGPAGALLDWVELVNLAADPVDLPDGVSPMTGRAHKARLPDGLAPPRRSALALADPEGSRTGLRLVLRERERSFACSTAAEKRRMCGYSDLGLDEARLVWFDGTGEGESMYIGTLVRPSPTGGAVFPLHPEGDDWKYLDGGQVPEGGMAGPWTGLEFDDAGWALAPLRWATATPTQSLMMVPPRRAGTHRVLPVFIRGDRGDHLDPRGHQGPGR